MPVASIQGLPDRAKNIFESTMRSLKGKMNPRTGRIFTDEERGQIAWSAVKRKFRMQGGVWVPINQNLGNTIFAQTVLLQNMKLKELQKKEKRNVLVLNRLKKEFGELKSKVENSRKQYADHPICPSCNAELNHVICPECTHHIPFPESTQQFSKQKFSKVRYPIEKLTVTEELSENGDLIIKGIALQEGVYKGIFYPREVLEKIAPTLIGVPLRFDHLKGIESIGGKVVESVYDSARRAILFGAKIFDDKAKRLVKEKLIDSVSIGVEVETVNSTNGPTVYSGEAKELSLVEDPACKTCKIEIVNN
ncbi:MAG TPA: hypothetical protein ENH95_06795 [Nitrosopumilus sp.]|nr:hypothetical protein [Nitrosopumilus sp.]